MTENLFSDNPELDADYLEAAYGDDAETAIVVFEGYLQELPSNIELINESYKNRDIDRFRHFVHKQKPGFSYVGLTKLTNKLNEIESKVMVVDDLVVYKEEIEDALEKISSSAGTIEKTLTRLRGL